MSLVKTIQAAVRANVPLIWEGPPGIGKTAFLSNVAESLGGRFVSKTAATLEPVDIGGVPVPNQSRNALTYVHDQSFAALINDDGKPVIFLIDEVNRGTTATFNALLRVVQERLLGATPMNPNVRIVMTANPVGTDPGAKDFPVAFANRCCFIKGEVPVADWLAWMQTQAAGHVWVAGYLSIRGDKISMPPKKEAIDRRSFPSRRSWDNVGKVIGTFLESHDSFYKAALSSDGEPMLDLIAGLIGHAEAVELLTWAKAQDIPKPLDLLNGTPLPPRPDLALVSAISVVSWYSNQQTSRETFDRVADWLVSTYRAGHKAVAATAKDRFQAVVTKAGQPFVSKSLFSTFQSFTYGK